MLVSKKSLFEQGFNISEPYFMAMMLDKIGKRFFIRAKTEKILKRLVKKCEKRGAICEFKKEVI
jgi:hypothetical protein